MRSGAQLAVGTVLLLAAPALMGYTVSALYGLPYVCACVLLWLCFVEYAVARSWWLDVCELRLMRGRHRGL